MSRTHRFPRTAATAALAAIAFGFLVLPARAASPTETEDAVLAVIDAYKAKSAAAANDMARGKIRTVRGRELCKLVRPGDGAIHNWTGTIKKLDSAGGKGVLAVDLSGDVTVTTMPMDLLDQEKTLIDPDSKLFDTVASLAVGQKVTFSGYFFPDHQDCMRQISPFLEELYKTPNYLFRFTDVQAVP